MANLRKDGLERQQGKPTLPELENTEPKWIIPLKDWVYALMTQPSPDEMMIVLLAAETPASLTANQIDILRKKLLALSDELAIMAPRSFDLSAVKTLLTDRFLHEIVDCLVQASKTNLKAHFSNRVFRQKAIAFLKLFGLVEIHPQDQSFTVAAEGNNMKGLTYSMLELAKKIESNHGVATKADIIELNKYIATLSRIFEVSLSDEFRSDGFPAKMIFDSDEEKQIQKILSAITLIFSKVHDVTLNIPNLLRTVAKEIEPITHHHWYENQEKVTREVLEMELSLLTVQVWNLRQSINHNKKIGTQQVKTMQRIVGHVARIVGAIQSEGSSDLEICQSIDKAGVILVDTIVDINDLDLNEVSSRLLSVCRLLSEKKTWELVSPDKSKTTSNPQDGMN